MATAGQSIEDKFLVLWMARRIAGLKPVKQKEVFDLIRSHAQETNNTALSEYGEAVRDYVEKFGDTIKEVEELLKKKAPTGGNQ